MSYNVRIASFSDLGLPIPPQYDDDHVHAFDETRVIIGLGMRFPVRVCACGRVTSNGIPGWADRVRVVT